MIPEVFSHIMQYFFGASLALIPLLAWGYFFYKKSPERKDLAVLSFCAGVLSVIPIFLVIKALSQSTIILGPFTITGLNIYAHIDKIATHGSLEQLGIYCITSILVFFLMYFIVGIVIFFLDILSGEQSVSSYQKILFRSLEAPFIFVTLGMLIGVCAFLFDWSLGTVLWKSMMIGAVEEFAKHLVLRFSEENKFRTINDVIEFSIFVALGFAFLENILYFVDNIWLKPCDAIERAANVCVFDPSRGTYVQPIGTVLVPFIYRSLFSTMTHIVASGIFGYYYGLSYFASAEIKEYAKQPRNIWTRAMVFIHSFLNVKGYTLFREQKILEGAVLAMVFHGLFDFVLDGQTATLFRGDGRIGLLASMLMVLGGGWYLLRLFSMPRNKQVWEQRNVLTNPRETSLIKAELQL